MIIISCYRSVYCLTNFFQNANIPHNLYLTRGSRLDVPDAGEAYSTVRVYVWARKPSAGKPVINICSFATLRMLEL
jgi:hypothetical protein